MAKFQFKTPEGSIFEFDAPDQSSALEAFQRNVPQGAAPAAAPVQSAPAQSPVVTDDFDPMRDLPLPYTPDLPPDPRTFYAPTQQTRAPEASPDNDRQAIEQGLAHAPGAIVGAPAGILDSTYGGFARIMDMLVEGDQSGRYANPTAWRDNVPFLNGLPTSEEINREIADPLYEGLSGNQVLQPDEMTGAQRALQTGAEFAGSAVVPSSILANPATRTFAQSLPNMGKTLGEVFTRPYLPGPRQATVLGDTFAAAGAGAVYENYQDSDLRNAAESVPYVGPALATAGDIAAGLVGGVGANAVHAAVPAVARQGVSAAKTIGRLGSPELDTNFQNPDGSYVKARDLELAARLVQGEGDPSLAEPYSTPREGMAQDPGAAAERILAQKATLAPYADTDQMATAGLASNDIGLIGQEQALRQSPKMRNAFIQRDQKVRQAAVDTVKSLAPEGSTGRQFTDTIDQQHAANLDKAEQSVASVRGELADVEQQRVQLGAELEAARDGKVPASQRLDRVIVDETLLPMQGKSSQMYAAADPTGQSMISSDPLLNAAETVYRSLGDLNSPAKVIPAGLLQRIQGTAGEVTPASTANTGLLDASGAPITRSNAATQAPNEVSVRSIVDALPELATTEERARRAGNYQLADNIRALRRSMDQALDDAATSGNQEAATAIAARQNYSETVGATFGGGPGDPARKLRKDFNLDRFGRSTTPPSGMAERFLQPGQPEKVASLRRIIDAAPDKELATRHISDWLAADLASSGGVIRTDGSINGAAVRKWADKWGGEALDIAPEFRKEIDNLAARADKAEFDGGVLAQQLRTAQEDLAETKAARGAIGRVLGRNPTKAVASLFDSRDPEAALADLAARIEGNESAQKGLKAAVVEFLIERATTSAIEGTSAGSNPLSFAKLDEILGRYEDALAGSVFSPDEMNALRAAHQFLAPIRNLNTAAVAGSQTAPLTRLYDEARIPISMALRLRYGLLKGGGIASVIDNAVALLPNGQGNADRLIARMYFDPDLAAHLLTRDVSRVGSPAWNRKLIALLTAGESLGVSGEEE